MAFFFFACNKNSDTLLEFDSRFSDYKDDTKKIIDFAADNFSYGLENEIDRNWCTIEKRDSHFFVTVKANHEQKERIAKILLEYTYGGERYTITVKQKAFYWSKYEQQIIDAIDIVEKVYPENVSILLDTLDYEFDFNGMDNYRGIFSYRSLMYNTDARVFFNLSGSAVLLSGGAKGFIYTSDEDGFEKGYFDIWLGDYYIKLTNDGN